jgi:hypothetical protein
MPSLTGRLQAVSIGLHGWAAPSFLPVGVRLQPSACKGRADPFFDIRACLPSSQLRPLVHLEPAVRFILWPRN